MCPNSSNHHIWKKKQKQKQKWNYKYVNEHGIFFYKSL